MRYVAAYLLAALGGNTSPSAKDIKAILGSVGIEADDERLDKVISELSGKDINEVMNSGLSKLASHLRLETGDKRRFEDVFERRGLRG